MKPKVYIETSVVSFKHINNPITRIKTRRVIENEGFICPEICSPDEFMGEEE